MNVSGTYTLVFCAGPGLPAVVSGSPAQTSCKRWSAAFWKLPGGSSFTWRTEYRYTNSGRVTASASPGGGRYSLTSTVITFTFEPGSEQLTGTLSNGVLTMRADVELVYRK